MKRTVYPSFSLNCAVIFICLLFTGTLNSYGQQNFGQYTVVIPDGWKATESNSEFFRFESSTGTIVKIKKEPALCETKQEFNKKILQIIQRLPQTQEYMEQRKQAAPYACLGQKYSPSIKAKSRATNQRRFILTPLIGENMYHLEVFAGQSPEPPADALNFIRNISVEGVENNLMQTAENVNAQSQRESLLQSQARTSSHNSVYSSNDALAAFKKNKSVAPPPPQNTNVRNLQPLPAPQQKEEETPKNTSTKITPAKEKSSLPPDITLPKVNISKGAIPDVKFSATNPCAPRNSDDGLPWENEQESKIELPDGVDAIIPPTIPGLDNLSDIAYSSAVSAAFEGMNLIYGEMTPQEAKEFQAAWAPLFDFPCQEIINYLNKLNPLISQFLSCREAYARNFAAIQMVLLDAATAIEFDDQQAWEMAMTEANIYTSTLPPLETAMKKLAQRVENLGNPPSPVNAKCEARRRYNNMFSGSDPVGCWAGFEDELAIREEDFGVVYEPKFVYIFKVRVNGVERYYSINICMDCNIGMSNQRGNCNTGDYGDDFVRKYILNTEQYTGKWIDGPRQGQLSQYVEKFDYPNIPQFSETSNERLLNVIKKDKELNGNWALWESTIQKMIESKSVAHPFFQTALDWTAENRWDDFDYPEEGWMCPDEVLVAFWNDMAGGAGKTSPKENEPEPVAEETPQAQTEEQTGPSEEEIAEQSRKEAIVFHNEMIDVIKHNLDRELKERDAVMKKLLSSKTEKEAKEHQRRLKDLNLRVIGLQSNMQSEMDLVASYKTGQLIHTRTAFDNYAKHKFISGIKENIKNIEATRRISERINRQIKLLPEEQREKARELARKTLDGKTIASGDIEKAKKLVNAFGKQIEGYAGYDYAQAKEEEAYAEIKEQAAQAGIMIVGIGAVGFGSAALVEAYGAEATAAIYGPKILGAIYGGTTGLIRGGPKEGFSQALMGWSPNGYALSQFIEGYQQAGQKKGATTSSQAWEGAKQAGKAWLVGKVFELGVSAFSKGCLAVFGKDSRLFKPLIQTSSQKSTQLRDALRTKQQELEAEDIVQAFEKLETQLATLKMGDEVANVGKISQLEDELMQLSASMNASYHAKWHMKYKASPRTMRRFDAMVQKNYSKMQPGMVQRMEQMGYKMDRIDFKQFRNAGSGGTSSMDLDLVPVQVGTQRPRTVFMKKDGTVVSAKEFMDDCQKAMNAEYRQITGMSAKTSDMNLVTSAHDEAFATAKLLDKSIDMSQFTDDEVASIGKVLKVKVEGIENNNMLTNTTKMQAKCRETAKEIENMMLRKLRSDLQKAPSGSSQAREIQGKIDYWEDMLARFKKIGMQESDPFTLMKLSNEIRQKTGGKDIPAVIDDVITYFGH